MDRYPYDKPPQWWSSKPSRFWMRLWRPWRKWQQRRDYRVVDIEVRGLERVRAAMDRGHGVLVTPNHAGHADCFLLFEALERLPQPPQVMTAWQVFELLPRLQQLVYRHHGCFSINREANDLTAFRHSVRVLEKSSAPLVIFPEGEVYHLNDLVTDFRDGTLAIAMSAVRRGGRPVACFPCALKYFFVDDPTAELAAVMKRLDARLDLSSGRGDSLAQRLRRFTAVAIAQRERQYLDDVAGNDDAGDDESGDKLGASTSENDSASLAARLGRLKATLIERLEQRLKITPQSTFLAERVKRIRQSIVERRSETTDVDERKRLDDDLERAFVAVQLYSYRPEYLDGTPSLERLAETIDKYEEDFLGVRSANIRGRKRSVIAFGEPLVLDRAGSRDDVPRLGEELRRRVQALIDALNAERAGH
ncbi:MAG: 1-acyl-sn-glycerol-3-phosphate acyltransferase [Pirellulales bacterium]